MTDEEAEANAASDPDNPPVSYEELAAAPKMPKVKVIRRALDLTQEEFAARYQIPLGTLRDWEQGRSEPDQPAKAYLKVIAANPEAIRQMLSRGVAQANSSQKDHQRRDASGGRGVRKSCENDRHGL